MIKLQCILNELELELETFHPYRPFWFNPKQGMEESNKVIQC